GVAGVLSGMASSSIGFKELPYKKLPVDLSGSDLNMMQLTPKDSRNPVTIVSGVQTENDVMRGEETKLIGWAYDLPHSNAEIKVLLPGTHPKHIVVQGKQCIHFETFMTGEFFHLLSQKSVLA